MNAYIIQINGIFWTEYAVKAENEEEAQQQALKEMAYDLGDTNIIDFFHMTPTQINTNSEVTKEQLMQLSKEELEEYKRIDVIKDVIAEIENEGGLS